MANCDPAPPQVFAALEDNVVTLSTMKASRYFAVFEREILYWEQALSLVSETIETILQVPCRASCSFSAN
jgi:dynein heavy chain